MILLVSVAIFAVFAVVLALYLRAEVKNDGKNGFARATGLKLTLSGLFCATGILSYLLMINVVNVNVPTQLFVLLGLFSGLIGDFFMQYMGLHIKKYITGVLCFAATQVLFITYLLKIGMPDLAGWIITLVITAAVIIFILVLMKKQNWQLGREKAVITLYTVLISFMAVRAIVYAAGQPSASSVIFATGAALCWSSDLLLGIWNYYSHKRVLVNSNWIVYFSGMLCIAFSILPAL
ncbi:MAG: lysoplasmalogenase family protein [Eubacteriales bacterium]